MQDDYSWNGGSRGSSSFSLPQNEGQTRWVVVSLVVAVLLHVLGFYLLGRIDVDFDELEKSESLQTQVVHVNPVDFQDHHPEVVAPETSDEVAEPVAVVPPADELDLLENIPDVDIDIKPDIDSLQVPEISSAAAGELSEKFMEPMDVAPYEPDLPEMGKTEDFFPRSDDAQLAVDPGARMDEAYDPDALVESMRKGAEGEAVDGLLKEFASLDEMAHMDGNALLQSKALIGSDLLFEFNSAQLRQSARLSLMKVALLIDKHPSLICWVDGHTDLIGRDAPNILLSKKRAMAVKQWLVDVMELEDSRIAIRGFGKQYPIVTSGDADQQAPNRRVEIKMRKQAPELEKPILVKLPPKPLSSASTDPPVKAILVTPNIKRPKVTHSKAIPLDEEDIAPRVIIEPEDDVLSAHKAMEVHEDEPSSPAQQYRGYGKAVPVEE